MPATAVGATTVIERLTVALRRQVVLSDDRLELVLVTLLARGHILLEDVPGVGKTLLARTLGASLGGIFHRIQFTPDLLPADITGGSVYDPRNGSFHFRAGPVFANVVLADEINRGTPRAQSSLLEAMGEGHVSVDGETHELPRPFLVVATQNPVEQQGTFPLPEAELDRFAVLIRLGRPDATQTDEILRRHEHSEPARSVEAVVQTDEVIAAQEEVLRVHASDAARAYVRDLTMATREHPEVGLPASPRAAVALLRTAQAMALTRGRDHLLPDDIRAVAVPVLAHRLAIPGVRGDEVIAELLDSTPIPSLP
jgi:MoxR-like ATPase